MRSSDSVRMPEKVPLVLVLMAVACFTLGLGLSPDSLLAFGIMRDSLLSDIERARHLAVLEVYGVKAMLLVLSALLLALVAYWKRFIRASLIQKICAHPCRLSFKEQEDRLFNQSFVIILMGMLLATIHILFEYRQTLARVRHS